MQTVELAFMCNCVIFVVFSVGIMAAMLRSDTRKKYSWWWDSHITPKNSKWLMENLTDTDTKVRLMIKIIEVDEDSFARRAEMYYKKRPELMKLVEEFYRSYRALAERYDHATGLIRQAHRTMAQVFPNQFAFSPVDGEPGSVHDSDLQTPDMLPLGNAPFDPDELQGDALGLSCSGFYAGKRNRILSEDLELAGRKGLKQLSNFLGAEERVRKGLNCHDANEKESANEKHLLKAHGLSEPEWNKSEADVQALYEALAKLEAEKLAGLLEYQKCLEKLSNLESEISRVRGDSVAYSERARKAEAEVSSLKEALAGLQVDREANLLRYQKCLESVANLEASVSRGQKVAAKLNVQASEAEKQANDLREELARLTEGKEANLAKYLQALEKIAYMENKLSLSEHDARMSSERANKAEEEVENLRSAIAKLNGEKEAIALQHQLCMEKIADLKHEVDAGVVKLKGVEEQYLQLESSKKSMQLELDTLLLKVGAQSQELTGKQTALGRLWSCIQEERLRYTEAEKDFQALQNLHSQAQEELRSAVGELQEQAKLLKEKEIQNQQLSSDIENYRDENKTLNSVNLSLALSIKTMQEEILNLIEGKEKMEEVLELRLHISNALQQEIYSLKELISDLSRRHGDVIDQIGSVGLKPESFGSSVQELLDENLKLKGSCQRNEVEITAILEKMAMMENLIQKNVSLENSLSNLSAELEGARQKVRELEDSFQLLLEEKSNVLAEKASLISQLSVTAENLEKLTERNTYLENSLFDVNAEVEALRVKSNTLGDSCQSLSDEKSFLVSERQSLSLLLESSSRGLEELEKRHEQMEKHSLIEDGRKASLRTVEELRASLDAKQQEHANSTQLSQMQIADMEKQIQSLEVELDKATKTQFEIFVLRKCVHDLKDKNSSLLIKFEKILEAFGLSEKLISRLESENLEQQLEVRLLTDQIKRLRMGMSQLCKTLEVDAGLGCEDITYRDQMILQNVLSKIDDTKRSLLKASDENQKLVVEKSVLMALLEQLKHGVADWKAVVNTLGLELNARNEKITFVQKDIQNLLQRNEELMLRVGEANLREELHAAGIESLRERLADVQSTYQNLERENRFILEENGTLLKAIANLEQEKHKTEHGDCLLLGDTVALDALVIIFKTIIMENSVSIKELTDNIDQLSNCNSYLESRLRSAEGNLELVHMERTGLELCLLGTENELEEVTGAKTLLEAEIEKEKSTLSRKERELLDAGAMIDSQGKQIFELYKKYNQQVLDSQLLQETIVVLDAEINRMNKQHDEAKRTLEALSMELQKRRDELELWETMDRTLCGELHSSSIREVLFREKLLELNKTYESLAHENYFNGAEVVKLREKVKNLADENFQMKAQLDAYSLDIASLRECVASLENHTTLWAQIGKEKKKDDEITYGIEAKTSPEPEKFADLMNVQTRIKAVEMALVEMKRISEEDSPSSRRQLQAAVKQIEALEAQNGSRQANFRSSWHFPSHEELGYGTTDGWRQLRLRPDGYEVARNELRMKDIMLDQASESSLYGRHRREISENDDHILELWETIEKDGSINLDVGSSQREGTVSPKQKHSPFDAAEEQISGRPSTESLFAKMCTEQDISKRFTGPPHEENRKRVLERLNSDLQKLNNLIITVRDLKKEILIVEYSSKVPEIDTAKEQLVEAEKMILKLLEVNGRLVKNVNVSLSSFDDISTIEASEGVGSARRRKVSQQARRCSEKVGRLQLEVQKIQFLLLKLNGDSNAGKGNRDSRALLRDYLYGGSGSPQRGKRIQVFGCVKPPRNGD